MTQPGGHIAAPSWPVKAPPPSELGWEFTGFVGETRSGSTLQIFEIYARPSDAVAAKFGSFTTQWDDLDVELNGVLANDCGYCKLIGTWYPAYGVYSPFAKALLDPEGWTCGDPIVGYIYATTLNGDCDGDCSSGSTTSLPTGNFSLKITNNKTSEVLLDVEFGLNGSTAKSTGVSICSTPSSATGSWTVSVNAGNVGVLDGVTWITVA